MGEFTIEKLIRSGGMAVVYQGFQKNLKRKVAIKVLPATLSRNEALQKLFQQEALVLANLSHPNIVPIYSYGQFENCPYFAMELIRGEALSDRIERRAQSFFRRKTLFPAQDVLRWIRPIAQALDYAHQKGVIHRDVKPSNILIDESDRVFITDFGLVRVFQMAMAQDMPCGTPAYMSYEQALGKDVDARTDIYSLGCIMAELLTGSRVSDAQTITEALMAFEKGTPKSLGITLLSVPPLLDQIVQKALSKDRNQRYQSMGEFIAVLDQFASGKLQARLDPRLRVQSRNINPKRGIRRAKWLNIGILLLLVATVALVMAKPWFNQWRESRRKEADAWCISQWQIAQNFRQNNMKEMAFQTYRKIVQRYPKHPVAQQAREELNKSDDIR